MYLEYQRIKFQWKKDQNFHICLRSGLTPCPSSQPDRKISVFLRLALQKLASYFITSFHPPSTWSNWRAALLHHTLREDTSSQPQSQLIKDRSQPSIIQYSEQSKVTKECCLNIKICLTFGAPCFLAGFGRGSITSDFARRQDGWWRHIFDKSRIFALCHNLIRQTFW